MMKNIGKIRFISIILSVIIMFSAIMSMFNIVQADEGEQGTVKQSIINITTTEDEWFNPIDIRVWAARVGSGTEGNNDPSSEQWPFKITTIEQSKIDSNDIIPLTKNVAAANNELDASDSAVLYAYVDSAVDSFKIVEEIAEKLNIDADDIKLQIKILLPENKETISYNIRGYENVGKEQTNSVCKKIFDYTKEQYIKGTYENLPSGYGNKVYGTEQKWNQKVDGIISEYMEVNELTDPAEVPEEVKYGVIDDVALYAVGAVATLPDGTQYTLVIGGNDQYAKNWYLRKVKGSDEFTTALDYAAIIDSKVVKTSDKENPFLPPYTEDDVNKKDADVIAYIKSKTQEEIVKIDDKEVAQEESKGSWYYPDINDKTVVAKKYYFDDYDNTKDNGKVREEVKVTGLSGRTTTEKPAIDWTFRRKVVETKENEDKSRVVTITYNLPVDENGIEPGWTPVYDEDGKTIHKITKTFVKGDKYDHDVTVKQNGTDATNTTHVVVEPNEQAKAGESFTMVFVIITIAGLALLSYNKYRRINIK